MVERYYKSEDVYSIRYWSMEHTLHKIIIIISILPLFCIAMKITIDQKIDLSSCVISFMFVCVVFISLKKMKKAKKKLNEKVVESVMGL